MLFSLRPKVKWGGRGRVVVQHLGSLAVFTNSSMMRSTWPRRDREQGRLLPLESRKVRMHGSIGL